jgi:hypothetical protein
MLISEILEYIAPDGWVWIADSRGQLYYGWAGFVSERLRSREVGAVSGDQNIAGVIDIYVKEER